MKRVLILFLAGLLMACSPRLAPPQITARAEYLYGEGFSSDTLSLQRDWWRLFGDTTLNRLVERALAHNRNLQVALSRIEETRHNLAVVRASFLPDVGVTLSAEGNYTKATKTTQQYAAEWNLSWELPLFESLKHTSDAARAEWGQAVWNYRGVELSLAAEVASIYFTLLQYERDLLIANRTYTLRRESASLIDSLFHYGMATGVEREQALSLVYSAEADIPRYRSAVEQTRLSLSVLTGDPPMPYADEGVGLELLTDDRPESLAIGVPSELLQVRPDIMQARFALDAAAAEAGLARSNRFPSIALTAKAGVGATTIKGLTSSNPFVWNALGALSQPVFNFKRLKRSEQIAIERYKQAALNYEQTVLEAFSDVETTLSTIEANRIETDRYTELVVAYRHILEMAYALYRNGMADYLDVIDAERTLYTAQMELVNLLAQDYINYVTLCKALGGGWRSEAKYP